LVEPSLCNKAKWLIAKPAIMNGTTKCKLKNLFSVALSIAKPPHNQSATLFPIKGIAEAKLVITVAPQNDI